MGQLRFIWVNCLATFWLLSANVLGRDFDQIEVTPSFDSVIVRWQKTVRTGEIFS